MDDFSPLLSALAGGLMIGVAVSLLLLLNGRLAGASGILAGLVSPRPGDTAWRVLFIGGLAIGTWSWFALTNSELPHFDVDWPVVVLGGVLTGIGTRIAGGCTSGHGVCGVARLAPRSLVATGVFMFAGMATVFVVRHILGG